MIGNFTYNGQNTLDFGLMIAAPPTISAAQRDDESIAVPGRDGVLRIDHGRYAPITQSYEIHFKSKKRFDVERQARAVKAWLLSGRGDYRLMDTYDREYYRIASFSGPMDISNALQWGGRTTASFQCHPYKYSYLGETWKTVHDNVEVLNPEAFSSRPLIRIYGTGTCEIYINNETIRINNVNEYVDIDSEAMQVFKGTASMNANTIMGEFPELNPGKNAIEWNSNVSSVKIIPRWRTL